MTLGLLTRYGLTRKIGGGEDPDVPDIITANLRAYYHFRDLKNGWINGHQPSIAFLSGNNSGGTSTLVTTHDWDGNGKSARHTRGNGPDSNIGFQEISPPLPTRPYKFKTRIYLPAGHLWTDVSIASELGSASHSFLKTIDLLTVDQWQELETYITGASSTTYIVLRGQKSGGTPELWADGYQIYAGEPVFDGGVPDFRALTSFGNAVPDLGPLGNHATPVGSPLPSVYGIVTSVNTDNSPAGINSGGGNLSGPFTITGVARLSPAYSGTNKTNTIIGSSANGGIQVRISNSAGNWEILRQNLVSIANGSRGANYFSSQWWTFTIRYDGSVLTLRFGGVDVHKASFGTGFNSAVPYWGYRANAVTENFEGCIVNGAIWTTALTDEQVADMELHMKSDAESLGLTVTG